MLDEVTECSSISQNGAMEEQNIVRIIIIQIVFFDEIFSKEKFLRILEVVNALLKKQFS